MTTKVDGSSRSLKASRSQVFAKFLEIWKAKRSISVAKEPEVHHEGGYEYF